VRFGGAVLYQLPYLLVERHLLEQRIDLLLDLRAGGLRVGRRSTGRLRDSWEEYKAERETGEQGESTVGHTELFKATLPLSGIFDFDWVTVGPSKGICGKMT
jgi:hypothetical protein